MSDQRGFSDHISSPSVVCCTSIQSYSTMPHEKNIRKRKKNISSESLPTTNRSVIARILDRPSFTSHLSANAIVPFQQIGQIVKGFKLVCTVRPFVLVTHSQRFRSSNRQLFAHCLFNCCYGTCGRPNVDRNWILSEVNPPIGLW